MLWTDTAEGTFLTNHGGAMLAEGSTFPGLRQSVESQGYLCVQAPTPGPAQRGNLAMLIEESIEVALERLGAVAPGVGASVDMDASVSDQLYRARLLERRGIVVFLPALEGMASMTRTLDGDDSLALSWWIQATQERPLGLVIEAKNRMLKVYPAPVAFESLLRISTYPPPAPATAPEQAASSDAMDLSESPPRAFVPKSEEASASAEPVALESSVEPSHDLPAETASQPSGATSLRLQLVDETSPIAQRSASETEPTETEPTETEPTETEPAVDAVTSTAEEPSPTSDPIAAHRVVTLDEPALPNANAENQVTDPDSHQRNDSISADAAPEPNVHEARTVKLQPSQEVLDAVRRASSNHPPPDPPSHRQPVPAASTGPAVSTRAPTKPEPAASDDEESTDPFHRLAQREWPNWLRELNSTRGPKPLAVVERTFVSAYTPLKEAWMRNLAGPEAKAALKTFADSFEHSYSEAFDALRVRGKRPTMVLDAPEIAQRIGRLHGARSIQLMLVDAMRFDLGLRIQDRLRKLSRGEASLAERLLFWSALPTTTETQLDLLGKGPSGLKEPIVPSDTPIVVARGKNAATARRTKVGHKEVIKLDIVESHIAEPGKHEAARLDQMADSVAQAVAEYFTKLPPRTLVMMFGDHGFLFDRREGGTSAGRSGGASPEEVLVPAFAWLVGSVH